MTTVSQVVVNTALNPSVSNHSKSTKKRLNMASITKITTIDAASMRNVFFISLINSSYDPLSLKQARSVIRMAMTPITSE
jgi:hypothetical protein